MLVDRAEIYVRGGRGGDGCMSFRREKFEPKGGPDGGDGGHGGTVIAIATPGVDTLLDFAGRHHWIAENGAPGMGKKMSGKDGEDLILRLPLGTLLYDRDTGVLIKDLAELNVSVPIAEGGRGGKGNARFTSSTHQAPREFEEGAPAQERWLRLELKLFADVGIVGLPNAGKSTLLSRLSRAKPKIADYPFTTLEPQLGIVELSDHRRMVLADIPGLIEGAHEGAGLGDAFLRHIERTRVILHLVDVGSDTQPMSPIEAYRTIRNELTKYSPVLAEKDELVVANKIDLTGGAEAATELAQTIGKDVLPISAVAGKGLVALGERLWQLVHDAKKSDHGIEVAGETRPAER
ncbi:MAG: GTPase ObgE [Planctomycetes bacterium]|nr:GTPase ObgE [Planctomycetota bacterium]MBI3833594.1 GTPase ObgE [Planctomycetota bacterium]